MKSLNYIAKEVLKKMYSEASPKGDYDKLKYQDKYGESSWYLKYYLSYDRQLEILSELSKYYGLTEYEKDKLNVMVLMGEAPATARVQYEEEILYGRKFCRGCIKQRTCSDRRAYVVYCDSKETRYEKTNKH